MTATGLSQSVLIRGVLWALAAGLCWGGAFIAPLMLRGYSAVEITAGRFTGAGLFSVIMFGTAVTRGGTLVLGARGLGAPRLWYKAFGLALLGNFIYFVAVTAAIQRSNAAIVTLIVGTLPIVVPALALLQRGAFAWSRALAPALLILGGLIAVHFGAHRPDTGGSGSYDGAYLYGLLLAVVALLSWGIYAVLNARLMAEQPQISAATWSSLQGVALLPLILPLLALIVLAGATHGGGAERAPFLTFLAVSVTLGIVTSWLASWCWNHASRLLPQELAGQLLVFETLASLAYVYLWFGVWPPLLVVSGTALLIAGVLLGVRMFRQ